MKNLIILTTIFLIITHVSTKSTIEVIYSKAYKNPKDEVVKIISDIEYSLLFDKSKSRFEYIEKMTNEANRNKQFIGKGGGMGVFFVDNQKNISLHQVDIFGQLFVIDKDSFRYEWNLSKEKKKILGYTCLKAIGTIKEYNPMTKQTLTHTVTAWYSPKFPGLFGPAEYFGLPGLVLEASKGSYYFVAKSINLESDKTILSPTKGKKVSKKEFDDILYQTLINKN